jgi:nitroimidazol reductase NimA-like FMN-containing flavoprotein (pyridoxamine 5'-phosphate oxidase superfamily)
MGGTMKPIDDDTGKGLATLGESACWELLPAAGVGRLAWMNPDGRIMVVPVNYGRDEHTVIVRTGATELLERARASTRVAFQVDDLEQGLRSGWTILFDGTIIAVEDADEAERLARLVDPWLREPRPYVLLLRVEQVTGRRVNPTRGGVQVVVLDNEERT